jgi:hypothetical protein
VTKQNTSTTCHLFNAVNSCPLLDRADAQSSTDHTYYGDAWVALGRVLLDTKWLSRCPPSPA